MGPAVTIVRYDARWPALFQEEKPLITEALGSLALALEHVGSTAVPGLAAKPILDLMLGVRQLSDATACIPKLQALGYAYEPEFEREIPEGRYFKKARAEPGPTTFTPRSWAAASGSAIFCSATGCAPIPRMLEPMSD